MPCLLRENLVVDRDGFRSRWNSTRREEEHCPVECNGGFFCEELNASHRLAGSGYLARVNRDPRDPSCPNRIVLIGLIKEREGSVTKGSLLRGTRSACSSPREGSRTDTVASSLAFIPFRERKKLPFALGRRFLLNFKSRKNTSTGETRMSLCADYFPV